MYNINVYNLDTEGNLKIGRFFKVKEFKCYDGSKQVLVSPQLVKVLDELRDMIGCPLIITSGYRTPTHNKKVGGAADSRHMYGVAADIYPQDKSKLDKLYYLADERLNPGGVGKYGTFVHVDVRTVTARWAG